MSIARGYLVVKCSENPASKVWTSFIKIRDVNVKRTICWTWKHLSHAYRWIGQLCSSYGQYTKFDLYADTFELKINISILFLVKNMLFDDAQSYTVFKSSCRLSQSVTSPTPEYILVSSAKLTSLDADTSLSISEIIIKNRRWPKMVYCGTPLNTGWSSLIPPGNRTKWDMLVRKWNNHIPIFPVIPTALSLCKRMPWSTLIRRLRKVKIHHVGRWLIDQFDYNTVSFVHLCLGTGHTYPGSSDQLPLMLSYYTCQIATYIKHNTTSPFLYKSSLWTSSNYIEMDIIHAGKPGTMKIKKGKRRKSH